MYMCNFDEILFRHISVVFKIFPNMLSFFNSLIYICDGDQQSPYCPGSLCVAQADLECCVAQDGPELVILLSQIPKYYEVMSTYHITCSI